MTNPGSWASIIIPARLQSSRFPRKVLAPILGKPMVQHVWESACRAKRVKSVFIATHDHEVVEAAASFGAQAVVTPSHFESGTDRIAHAAQEIPGDIIINLQGDEPLLPESALDALVDLLELNPEAGMATLAVPCVKGPDLYDSNVVKVVCDRRGRALYFSRQPLVTNADGGFLRHVGVYAFRRATLMRFCSLPPGNLERAERLEQLRALENNIPIVVGFIDKVSIAVDTPADLEKVTEYLVNTPKERG